MRDGVAGGDVQVRRGLLGDHRTASVPDEHADRLRERRAVVGRQAEHLGGAGVLDGAVGAGAQAGGVGEADRHATAVRARVGAQRGDDRGGVVPGRHERPASRRRRRPRRAVGHGLLGGDDEAAEPGEQRDGDADADRGREQPEGPLPEQPGQPAPGHPTPPARRRGASRRCPSAGRRPGRGWRRPARRRRRRTRRAAGRPRGRRWRGRAGRSARRPGSVPAGWRRRGRRRPAAPGRRTARPARGRRPHRRRRRSSACAARSIASAGVDALHEERERHVLDRRQRRDQARLLEDHARPGRVAERGTVPGRPAHRSRRCCGRGRPSGAAGSTSRSRTARRGRSGRWPGRCTRRRGRRPRPGRRGRRSGRRGRSATSDVGHDSRPSSRRRMRSADRGHGLAVAGDQDGAARLGPAPQQRQQPCLGRLVELAGGLVGQEHRGSVGERDGQRRPDQLAARQLVGPRVRPRRDAEVVEQRRSGRAGRGGRPGPGRAGGCRARSGGRSRLPDCAIVPTRRARIAAALALGAAAHPLARDPARCRRTARRCRPGRPAGWTCPSRTARTGRPARRPPASSETPWTARVSSSPAR